MKREKRNPQTMNKKWISNSCFVIAIILLTIAIILSAKETKNKELTAKVQNTSKVSSEMSKSVNQVENISKMNPPKTQIITNETSANVVTNSNEELPFSNRSTEVKKVNAEATNSEDSNNKESLNNHSNSQESKNKSNLTKAEESEKDKNTTKIETENKNFIMPVNGEIKNAYSMDSLIYSETLQEWVTHRGIDIVAEKQTEVKSIADGTIKAIKNDPRYGLSVIVSYNENFEAVYSCLLSTAEFKAGDKIAQGQAIGIVGNSGVFEVAEGTHLHFELLKSGEYVNPEIYLK